MAIALPDTRRVVFDDFEAGQLGVELDDKEPQEIIEWALETFGRRISICTSFQADGMAILDMAWRLDPRVRVFTIDTGVLFPETYATWRALERRTGVNVEVFDADDRRWTADDCCGARKVAALERALGGLDAWVTGLRREQAPTRAFAPKLGWDERQGLWKVSPLADWTEKQVWDYIAEHELPYNPLHDRGYASIGCAPCTHPGRGREGRWAGQDKTECGLHAGS